MINRSLLFTHTKLFGQARTWFWRSSSETYWDQKGVWSKVKSLHGKCNKYRNRHLKPEIPTVVQDRNLTETYSDELKVQGCSLCLSLCKIAFLNQSRETGERALQRSGNSSEILKEITTNKKSHMLFLSSFTSAALQSYWLINIYTIQTRLLLCSSPRCHWPSHFRYRIHLQQSQELWFGWVTSSKRVPSLDPKTPRDGESTRSPGDVLQWLTTFTAKSCWCCWSQLLVAEVEIMGYTVGARGRGIWLSWHRR